MSAKEALICSALIVLGFIYLVATATFFVIGPDWAAAIDLIQLMFVLLFFILYLSGDDDQGNAHV